jgi:hypothetical protein
MEDSFVDRALETWAAIEDPRKCVLYLFSSADDEPEGRWVHFPRVDYAHGRYRWTQWFDLQAFLVGRSFYELLDHRVFPVHPNRWKRKPAASSGVGMQLTRRLFRRGHIYQVSEPLARHGSEPSLMNPEARLSRPLDNRHYVRESSAARAR